MCMVVDGLQGRGVEILDMKMGLRVLSPWSN